MQNVTKVMYYCASTKNHQRSPRKLKSAKLIVKEATDSETMYLKARRLGKGKEEEGTDNVLVIKGIDRGAGENGSGSEMDNGEWRGLGRDKREQETLVTRKAGKRKRRNATESTCCAINRT